MFKLQSPSKHSLSDAIQLSRIFSTVQNRFLNSSIMKPFSASALFLCFALPLPYWQNIPLWGLFHSRTEKKKKSLRETSGEQWGWNTGIRPFLAKNCWTLSMVCTGRWITGMGKGIESLQKNSLGWRTQPQNGQYHMCSDCCGSVGWALSHKPKGHWFDSQSGYLPRLRCMYNYMTNI